MARWLDQIAEALRQQRAHRVKSQILAQISERCRNHDFTGEAIDDRWADHMSLAAAQYITEEEYAALGDDSAGAVGAVLREYVIWLARVYGVDPNDLE